MAGEQKTETLRVRLGPTEKRSIELAAEARGITSSDLVRGLVLPLTGQIIAAGSSRTGER